MNELDFITSFWGKWLMIPSFFIGFIGVIYIILSQSKFIAHKDKKKTGLELIGVFVFIWGVGYSLFFIMDYLALKEVRSLLNEPNIVLKINNKKLEGDFLKDVKNQLILIDNFQGHNSHPTEKIEIKIESQNKSITLRLHQDSEIKKEFWVFLNDYNYTRQNYIGKIQTTIFKKYFEDS